MLKTGIHASLLVLALLATSCRERGKVQADGSSGRAEVPELATNALTSSPAGLLAARANSPVHWQHWEPATLQRAKDAQRPIFAIIGSARYSGCLMALDAIDADKGLTERLNGEFVPVLVDLDFCSEAGLAAAVLSHESRTPVAFPFILVLSPDGHEVSWQSAANAPGGNVLEMCKSAVDVVANIWRESPNYVGNHSAIDHADRLGRLLKPDPAPANAAERDEQLARAVRQLASLYEDDSSSMSGSGGLLPLGILQCLSSAALDPDTPPEMARRCQEVVSSFGKSVLHSAMVDPLDGGVYSNRRGASWELPMFERNCSTQARAARALATLYHATGDPRALEVALGAVKFAEEQFAAQTGLFSLQSLPRRVNPADWLWRREQVDQALAGAEAELWKTMCGISGMGNLPLEADPTREFFRLNSLGLRTPLASAAEKQGISAEEAGELLESGRKKLLRARRERIPDPQPNPAASAAPSFRMISAYAALFTVTGDPAWRDKAVLLAEKSQQTFAKGSLLVEQNPGLPEAVCDARAFTYALAIQAELDLAEITLDENWRIRAGDLATTVAEAFVDEEGRLIEARPGSTPLKIPLENRVMVFDDSTAGLMRMNLARLEALGQSPPPALAPWIRSVPPFTALPVIFTDSILAVSFARSRIVVSLPEDASPEWREAACRLPLDRIARRIGKVPAAKAIGPGGKVIPLGNPAALGTFVRPPRP